MTGIKGADPLKDMKQKQKGILKVLTALALLCAVPLAGPAGAEELSAYGNPFAEVVIKGVKVEAEVVKTPKKVFLGLSYRKSLPKGRGMLFIMPEEEVQHFCMRGMRFAIDIIWITQGKVIGCEKNVPPTDPRTLSSLAPVRYVLEVPAGFCDIHKITAGDTIHFSRPKADAAASP